MAMSQAEPTYVSTNVYVKSRVEPIPEFLTPILTHDSRPWSHDSGVNSNRLRDLYCRLRDFRIGCLIFVIGFVIFV